MKERFSVQVHRVRIIDWLDLAEPGGCGVSRDVSNTLSNLGSFMLNLLIAVGLI